jgi:LysM repeat protein/lysophospholipase L1-like esterase
MLQFPLKICLSLVLASTGCAPKAEKPQTPVATKVVVAKILTPAPKDSIPKSADLEPSQYPYIDFVANVIERREVLLPFFKRLDDLRAGKSNQVRILHLGDSHVQGDYFTGWLRAFFQHQYGAAGRGLVFPYREAGSYNARDIKTSATGYWQGRKSTFQNREVPIGLSAMGMRTYQENFELTLLPQDRYGLDQRFNTVTIFHEKGPEVFDMLVETGKTPSVPKPHPTTAIAASLLVQPFAPPANLSHKVRSGESLYSISRKYRCTIVELRKLNGLNSNLIHPGETLKVPASKLLAPPSAPAAAPLPLNTFVPVGAKVVEAAQNAQQPFLSIVHLDSLSSMLRLKGLKRQAQQERTTLFGLLLENNTRSGVLYCAAGANGVTYYHYNHAEYFVDQAALLYPDLIIITLGTNEAFLPSSKMAEVEREVDAFLQKLQTKMPQVPILVTIHPDVLKNKSLDNTTGMQVRDILRRQTQAHRVASWDFPMVMGGLGSMRRWRSEGLAQADGIHFTERGYLVKAQLLYQALQKAYAAD